MPKDFYMIYIDESIYKYMYINIYVFGFLWDFTNVL